MMALNEALSEELQDLKKHAEPAQTFSTTDLATMRQEIESLRSGYMEVGGRAALRRTRLCVRVEYSCNTRTSSEMKSSGVHEQRRWQAVFARDRSASLIENAVAGLLQHAKP